VAEDPAVQDAPEGVSDPQGVAREVTPSGIEVYYQSELHDSKGKRIRPRLYRVRRVIPSGDTQGHTPWREVPSVTTVLEVLDKPALPWWGMKIGAAGVIELIRRGVLDPYELITYPGEENELPDVEALVELLKQENLTTNDVRDAGGDRGQAVHDAFEKWAALGVVPEPDSYPEAERGYVQGLRDALDAIPLDPSTARPEVMVGSYEHGFAGRYDLRVQCPREVTVKVNSRRSVTIPAGTGLWDLKTSKGIYSTHELQLGAYELASVECGYPPTDYQAVLRVGADGSFEPRISRATGEDSLKVLAVHEVLQRVKGVPK
jgi:hypothetical protein